MSGTVQQRGQAFAKMLAEITPERRDQINELTRRETEVAYRAFVDAFNAGKCSLCGDDLTSFDAQRPCRHWLLNPDGFRKQDFEKLASGLSLSQLEGYLRWVANQEAFAKNINDLADEGSGKLVELTIKYKNLAWSFSCGASDLAGHEGGGEISKVPHYHFQMYVDGKPFIRYNDFHLPLSEVDIGFLEHQRVNPGMVQWRFAGGTGMAELLDESTLEQVVKAGRSGTSDEEAEAAPIELNTFVFAEPGKSISGEAIYKLIQEAKNEGVTVTSKLQSMQGATVQTIVSPGPGVVHQATRNKRKKRKDPQLLAQVRAWREDAKRKTPEAK